MATSRQNSIEHTSTTKTVLDQRLPPAAAIGKELLAKKAMDKQKRPVPIRSWASVLFCHREM